jgi:hypothetical protein
LRAEHKDGEAHAMLLKVEPASLAREHTARWWNEVAVQARDALTLHDPRTALALVEHAALPVGDQYAEQQFLVGFIALRFLKEPARALPYFQRLGANVTRPISKSRAEYWQGRTEEALNDNAAAYRHYRLAAAYPETFYGQLAIARTEADPVLHLSDTSVEAAAKSEIETDTLMPQIKVLADLGLDSDLRLFAEQDATAYSSPRHLKQFMASLSDWGYRDIAVRLAKEASYAGAAGNITGSNPIAQGTVSFNSDGTLANVNGASPASGTVSLTLPWNSATSGLSSQTIAVTQATAASLNATVSIASAQTLATVTTVGTVTTITNDVNVQPATDNLVWGAASATNNSSTQAIAAQMGKVIYVTSVRVKNSSATTVTVLVQDGSGGTTLDTLIAPAGGGDNSNAGGATMYKTTSGNGLYFQASTGETTIYCNASGFSK